MTQCHIPPSRQEGVTESHTTAKNSSHGHSNESDAEAVPGESTGGHETGRTSARGKARHNANEDPRTFIRNFIDADSRSSRNQEPRRTVNFDVPTADTQNSGSSKPRFSGRGSRTRRQLETHIADAPGKGQHPTAERGGRISGNTRSKTRTAALPGKRTPSPTRTHAP